MLDDKLITERVNGNLLSGTLYSYRAIKNQLDCSEGVHGTHIDDVLLTKNNEYYSKVFQENNSFIVGIANGLEVNTTSLMNIKDFSIDTRDFSLDEIKKISPSAYEFLLSRKETRLASIGNESTYPGWKGRWWQHWSPRAKFLNKYAGFPFLCVCKLTKYPVPRKLVNIIGTNKTLMFPLTEGYIHCICLSSFFRLWLTCFNGAKQGDNKSSISLRKLFKTLCCQAE